MDELIQVIKILDTDQVEKINKYADTLKSEPSKIFNSGDNPDIINTSVRSSTSAFQTIMLLKL